MTERQFDETWTHVREQLKAALSEGVYRIWLAPLVPAGRRESVLYVEAPIETRDWINRRFGPVLTTAARSADPSVTRVELVPQPRSSSDGTDRESAIEGPEPRNRTSLRRGFSFDHFVIGKTNRFAHAAALAAAEMPGHVYSPLFIHGPSGVGKTHLLQAIGNYVTAHDSQLSLRYTTAESFTTDFVSALQRRQIEPFKRSYRELDVLLVDDVHFLERKDRTVEEFLFTLEATSSAGAQVALAGNRHPRQMPSLGDSLTDRLQGGLVVELDRPDAETRLAILCKIASGNPSLAGKPDLLELLATRLPTDIRTLEGALIKLTAYASLTNRQLTSDLIDEVLPILRPSEDLGAEVQRAPHVTLADIRQVTCHSLELDSDALLSTSRARYIVYARQVAMYLARDLAGLTFPAIAKEFGSRDHTVALYAYRKTRERLASDPKTKALVDSITNQLRRLNQPS